MKKAGKVRNFFFGKKDASFADLDMQKTDSSRPGIEQDPQTDKNNNNVDNAAVTEGILRKLKKMEVDKTSENDSLLVGDTSMRKSASFTNIGELSDDHDCSGSIDLRMRGSDPRSQPKNPVQSSSQTSRGKPKKPWELQRSSTPIPGTLSVSSVLRKALGRFSPEVGHLSVKENEELE